MNLQQGQLITYSIPAAVGGFPGLARPPTYGQFFSLTESPVPVGVKLGALPESVLVAGQELQFPPGERFDVIELRNFAAYTIKVTVWIGFVRFNDTRRQYFEPPTELLANPATTVPAGAGVMLPGTPTDSLFRRKMVLVTNEDSGAKLQVRDGAGIVAAVVFPEQTVSLGISGAVEVWNATGAPIAARIAEIWFVR